MDNIIEQEIIDFIEKEYWKSNLKSDSDIFDMVKIDGDDCDELIIKYSEKYSVNMDNYLWYFHHQEEASINRLGSMIFKTPDKLVNRIPITPNMLTEFANSKTWNLDYPEHKFPKYRYDLIITYLILLFIIAINIYHYIK